MEGKFYKSIPVIIDKSWLPKPDSNQRPDD